MKKITIPCDFGGVKVPYPIYMGEPHPECHPLKYQAAWISEERSGTVPREVMESFAKLQAIAEANDTSFTELVIYALDQAATQAAPAPAAGTEVPPAPADVPPSA